MFDALVFIMRGQPVTKAHVENVRVALTKANRVIVLFGSANSPRTIRNPWTYAERVEMLRGIFTPEENKRIVTKPLNDYTYNDVAWIRRVQSLVMEAVLSSMPGNSETVTLHGYKDYNIGLIGHSKDNSSYYLNLFPQWGNINVPNISKLNATDVREDILSELGIQGSWKVDTFNSVEPFVKNWLLKWIETPVAKKLREEKKFIDKFKESWANSPYPPTFNTVDAVVVQSGHVLMVRRGAMPGEGMLALPGGYVKIDETLKMSAIRELREETKLKVPEAVLLGSIVHKDTYDDPNRSARGRVITTAFYFKLKDGKALPKVKGSDDAKDAFWIPISEVKPEECFEDHYFILHDMIRGANES